MIRRARAWLARLGGSLGSGAGDRDFDAELQSHLQLHIDDNVRAGMAPAEARRQALIALGGMEQVRQEHRARRGVPVLDHRVQDLRHGIRALRAGASWAAIVMLACAIGLTSAMFAVVDALMLRPVPFKDADRLAWVCLFGEHGGPTTVKRTVLDAWREHEAFEAAEGAWVGTSVLDAGNGPVSRPSAQITPGLFDMLGVAPLRGRLPEDGDPGVLISADLWRSTLGADASIIGRSVRLDGEPAVVIGILPAGFHFPQARTEIWRLAASEQQNLLGYVRIAKDVPEPAALAVATEIAHRIDPSTVARSAVREPIAGAGREYYREALPLLAGGVVLLFLVLSANVGCLLLTRFTARRREFAVCAALGATRGRLLWRAFGEAMVLAVVGSGLGLALAWQLVALARRLLPEAFLLQTLHPLQLGGRAVLVAISSAIVMTLIAGLVPAWAGSGSHTLTNLDSGERTTASTGARLSSRGLLVAEIALACTLLVGSVLLIRSFVNLSRIDVGFDPRGLMVVQLNIRQGEAARAAAVSTAEERLRQLPGVERLVWSSGAPQYSGAIEFADWESDRPGGTPVNFRIASYFVGAEFFSAYGLPILRGRPFEPNEDASHVIVGERVAAALWPDTDPVGHAFWGNGQRLTVIGVAKELRRPLTGADTRLDMATLFRPFVPHRTDYPIATLRCAGACPSEGSVRARLLGVTDVWHVTYLESAYDQDLAQSRTTAALGFVFAGIALVAAAGGLYSVLSYAVTRRRREFGIRLALGGSTSAICALVVRDAAVVAAAGGVIGVAAAWSLARTLEALRYGVTINDPLSWALVFGALAIAVVAAAWRPTRSAMRTDPLVLLGEE